jgi:Homeodomain-like domain
MGEGTLKACRVTDGQRRRSVYARHRDQDPARGTSIVNKELQVRRAREFGWSWQQIAELLGVSKQAVHQKYGKGGRRPRRSLR